MADNAKTEQYRDIAVPQDHTEVQICGEAVLLENSPHVWFPHDPTHRFLETIISSNQVKRLSDGDFLVIGTGSGVIPIVMKMKGVGSNFLVTDYNKDAVSVANRNVAANGYEATDITAIQADKFDGVSRKFSVLFSNLPVQPSIEGAHDDDPAAKSNENGTCREVLDAVIMHGGII